MKDVFSLHRFGWLLKKTFLERPMQLMGLMGLMLLADLVLYTVCRYLNMPWEVIQTTVLILGLVGGGCFLGSFVFNYFSSNASGTSFLTLPASSFEKWLCGVLVVGVVYTVIFLLFFRLIDAAFVSILHHSLDVKGPRFKEISDGVQVMPLDGFIATKTYMMFLNFTGAMLIGSLYFNKAAFIKVALLACGLYIGGHFLNQLIANLIFSHIEKALPYYCVFIPVGNEFGKVLLPPYASAAVDICLLYVVPAILWVVTLVRLREKEF